MRYWREYMKFPVIAVAFAVLVGYTLIFINSGETQQTIGWPAATAIGPGNAITAQSTSAVQIIGTNPTRRWITICNVSNSTTAWIAPLPLVATTRSSLGGVSNGAGSIPLYPIQAGATNAQSVTANCYNSPFAGASSIGVASSMGAAWNAIVETTAVPPSTGNLTILEY